MCRLKRRNTLPMLMVSAPCGFLRLFEFSGWKSAYDFIKHRHQSCTELFRKSPSVKLPPFYPRSPYAAAKLYAYWIIVNYREAYGFHASNGILFNHESPIRGETFVTRKISRAVAGIKLGRQEALFLGNLDAKRDWGHARDYVEGMWRILQQPEPNDYVLATGETHSVREFVEKAFQQIGVRIVWEGVGVEEKGLDAGSGRVLVEVDRRYFRPTEVDLLVGDPSKARSRLGWQHTVSFDQLVAEMVAADLKAVVGERSRVLTAAD
jgi:GDPmannose 4,6-dehydratase